MTVKTEGAYRVDVAVAGERTYASNGLRFDTEAEATAYARDLYSRWTLMVGFRVVPSDQPQREAIA